MEQLVATGMSLEEFVYQYETEGRFELWDGERIPVMATKKLHSDILHILFKAILFYLANKPIGDIRAETTYVLAENYGSAWVRNSRIPDLLFYESARLAEYIATTPDAKEKPFMLVPDLVVEILSDTDTYTGINRKVGLYLRDGVQEIWVIDPKAAEIAVHAPTQETRYLEKNDTLTSPLLPDFSMPVQSIF